jgi:hypothetical protein
MVSAGLLNLLQPITDETSRSLTGEFTGPRVCSGNRQARSREEPARCTVIPCLRLRARSPAPRSERSCTKLCHDRPCVRLTRCVIHIVKPTE